MSKALVLAEKPSVGRDIGRVLGCQNKGSHLESDRYIVTWALGHLVTLASPEKYDKPYETWQLATLPFVPQPFKLEIIKSSQKQFYVVKNLLKRKDISQVIIATDAGREGELVARWILEMAGAKLPLKRLWISSVTDQAISEGFKNLKDAKAYDALYEAALARAKADWVVGLNGTKAMALKYNAPLSLGRVQTPTLALVKEREDSIRQFVPRPYYHISAKYQGLTLTYTSKEEGSQRLFDKSEAEAILKRAGQGQGQVKSILKKEKIIYKTGFFDLTELQREANRLYDYSAKETLKLTQSLYEKHKVLTYPRTDSKYITDDMVPTLLDRLRACKQSHNSEAIGQIVRNGIKGGKHFVNKKLVSDHHGLIPTEVMPSYHTLSPKELKIYQLVVARFIEVLMPPSRMMEISMMVDLQGLLFRGKASHKLGQGQAVPEGQADMDNLLGSIKVGDQVVLSHLSIDRFETKAPTYMTEGDLLLAMEKSGLGTVATRADMIEKVLQHAYIEAQGKVLRVTGTGRQLLSLVPSQVTTKELTAKWERALEKISKGQYDATKFMGEMVDFTRTLVQEIDGSTGTFKHDNVTGEACPTCGAKLLMVTNKYGKRLVCQDRACGYRRSLQKATNARCPDCHKKLNLVGEGEGQTFVCACGYKEKLKAFEARRAEKKQAMNKREVQKYLNTMDQEEASFNNPFAGLLDDFKKNK